MARHTPETRAEIEDIILDALQEKTPLKITGFGTKSGLGGQVQTDDELSLSGHSGIIDYQPEELVLVVKSGTPLLEIEETLSQKGQMLAFEPPHLAQFYSAAHPGSIGGIIACNLSGPRRISAGAARDYLLGFDAISGRAGYFRSGSKVMKNVTGYDLSKLMCGSFGMLAVMSEITLKVLPRPEYTTSLSIICSSLTEAQSVLATGFGSATEPSGGAIVKTADGFRAVLRLEGVQISVADRVAALSDLLSARGQIEVMPPEQSAEFWRAMRDIACVDAAAEQVWKLSVTPSFAPRIIAALEHDYKIDYALDWAGGLIWVAGNSPQIGPALRKAVTSLRSGFAMLVRDVSVTREKVEPFQPLEGARHELHKRVKSSFDPLGVLNYERMHEGV